jgi:hypothetical protein
MIAETHLAQGDMLIRDILDRMRHDGWGGRAGRAELLTGIEGVSSRPVRRSCLSATAAADWASAPWLWCHGTAAASFRT